MSWLKVPKAVDDTPRSSNGSSSSESDSKEQDNSVFDSNSSNSNSEYSKGADETSGAIDKDPKVKIRKQAVFERPSSKTRSSKSGSVDLGTPQSPGREQESQKHVKYDTFEDTLKPNEKVYENISEYFLAYHSNLMRAWYETTKNMLINKQDYAVEAVKLEWLLKKQPKLNLRNLRKSKEETLEMREVEKELEIIKKSQSDANLESIEDDDGDDNTNTLSDISDEIMDGRGKRIDRTRKHDPKRDARRLNNLMYSKCRQVY